MYSILNIEQKKYISGLLREKIKPKEIKNEEIREILSSTVTKECQDIHDITSVLKHNFSAQENKSDGITFTPIPIVKYMFEDVTQLDCITNIKIADLSVGNGAFFIGLIIHLKEKNPEISITNLIENNLFGYDIKKENIFYTKLNLLLIALYYGENPDNLKFNLHEVDTLKYFNNNPTIKFDLIVGNPPYVKQQNIPSTYREYLLNNYETINSNYNLYYAFLELSIKLLNYNGISLQLVPNYLLKIKSASTLRNYLMQGNHISKIVNFNANKLFDGIDTYTMIIELKKSSEGIYYKSLPNNDSSLSSLLDNEWRVLTPSNITQDSINLISDKEEELVKQVQSQLFTLDISTGIATQKDKLFLIDDTKLIDNKYMSKIYKGKIYKIEKESVVRIYKGSGQKSDNLNYHYIIYPYIIKKGVATLKNHEYLLKYEPMTYKYFIESKADLVKRSGVKNDVQNWYKYGRTQSLNRFETKILFPTNTLKPNFNLIKDNALFFNGYAIYGLKERNISLEEFNALEIILNSKLVEIFMLNTSYFIGSGYVSYQKKYIEKVTIPLLTDSQISKILNLKKSNMFTELNNYIFQLYNLDYNNYNI